MSLQSANTQEVGIFLWPGPFCNTFLLKLVPHSPPPSPPQPATKAWVNSSWVFLSHSTQLNSHAESAVQHRCQFWSAKPNPLSSAFKIRVGTQLLFILCCMHHFHGPNPTSSYTIFMFQTLHSKFNSGVFRILKEIQIFFLQSNSKTFHINIYIKIWSLFPIVILKPSNVPSHPSHLFIGGIIWVWRSLTLRYVIFFHRKRFYKLEYTFLLKNIFVHTFNLAMVKNWRNHLPMAKFLD